MHREDSMATAPVGRGNRTRHPQLIHVLHPAEMPLSMPIPSAWAPSRPRERTSMAAVASPCQPTVLLIEDDELLLDAMIRTLVRQGYLVLSARSGHEAMNLLYRPLQPITAVVLDLYLPDVSGQDLGARIRELYPSLPVVVCTGSTDPADIARLMHVGVRRWFIKPVAMSDCLAWVAGLANPSCVPGGQPSWDDSVAEAVCTGV